MSFDTHEAVKRLRAVQLTEVQAEVMVSVVLDARATTLRQLVTRDDLDRRLDALKRDLTNRLAGMGILAIGAAVSCLLAVKFLAGPP